MQKLLSSLLLLIFCQISFAQKIIILNNDVAEFVIALGVEDQVIGRDTHTKLPGLEKVKSIGNPHSLTAEPIISLRPDLVVGSYLAQPVMIYQKLNSLGVKAVKIIKDEKKDSYIDGLKQLGVLVKQEEKANLIVKNWQDNMQALPKNNKKYLLTYEGLHVAGKDTVGDELIRLAGGINVAGDIQGLKPMSREAWLMAQPDIIIIAKHNLNLVGGSIESFAQRVELKNSPAAKNLTIEAWDANEFLTFTLNSPEAVKKLHQLGEKVK